MGLSLLVVGAGLRITLAAQAGTAVAIGVLSRLVVMPAIMFLACWWLGIDGLPRTIAIIASAVPTASSSYVMARQMGGDAPLMANIITFQVILAAFTLPIAIWIADSI